MDTELSFHNNASILRNRLFLVFFLVLSISFSKPTFFFAKQGFSSYEIFMKFFAWLNALDGRMASR
jgi:hypothetical protein